jgi:hypothetical protein
MSIKFTFNVLSCAIENAMKLARIFSGTLRYGSLDPRSSPVRPIKELSIGASVAISANGAFGMLDN